MSAVIMKNKREDLYREISDVLHKWPDRERRIFARAHYKGQSPESISHSLKLDIETVSTILEQCNRKLHLSLRDFRAGGTGKSPLIPTKPAGRTSCNR